VVTRQLQVERRTGKVRRRKTDVLPLCHPNEWCIFGPVNVDLHSLIVRPVLSTNLNFLVKMLYKDLDFQSQDRTLKTRE